MLDAMVAGLTLLGSWPHCGGRARPGQRAGNGRCCAPLCPGELLGEGWRDRCVIYRGALGFSPISRYISASGKWQSHWICPQFPPSVVGGWLMPWNQRTPPTRLTRRQRRSQSRSPPPDMPLERAKKSPENGPKYTSSLKSPSTCLFMVRVCWRPYAWCTSPAELVQPHCRRREVAPNHRHTKFRSPHCSKQSKGQRPRVPHRNNASGPRDGPMHQVSRCAMDRVALVRRGPAEADTHAESMRDLRRHKQVHYASPCPWSRPPQEA